MSLHLEKGDRVELVDAGFGGPEGPGTNLAKHQSYAPLLGTFGTVEHPGWTTTVRFDSGEMFAVFPWRLRKVEPEDNDDLYVEPEPLRKGDAVLVWVTVDGRVDSDGDVRLKPAFFGEVDPTMEHFYSRSDAIVRPDAGQVPPWVKPAQCTSLKATGRTTLHRCEGEEGHGGDHVVGWVAWTDAEAYGRVEVSS